MPSISVSPYPTGPASLPAQEPDFLENWVAVKDAEDLKRMLLSAE